MVYKQRWRNSNDVPEHEQGVVSSSTPQFKSAVLTGPGQDVLSFGFIQNLCRFLKQFDELISQGPYGDHALHPVPLTVFNENEEKG